VLTLFTTPVIYLWFDRLQQRYFNIDDAVRDAEQGSAGQGRAEQGSPAE
jgi:hypothetical protein